MLNLTYLPNSPDTGGWKGRHIAATTNPKDAETPIVNAINAWCEYAVRHGKRFETKIGEDGVLGPAWARWGSGLRELLNGETGRLDCGTLDHILAANLTEQGFDPDKI